MNLRLLKSEKGTIFSMVIAVIVVAISLASSVSILAIAHQDTMMANQSQDLLQQELLLRAEIDRLKMFVEVNENRPLPDKQVEIIEEDRVRTYSLDNDREQVYIDNFMGFAQESAYALRSLATVKAGRRYYFSPELPSKRYIERLIKHESLAQYQYFSNREGSENSEGNPTSEAGRVKFWGPDVLNGKVHSNSDIYIQNAGGGDNGGWPTFHDMVTTTGQILIYPNDTPVGPETAEQVFLGGYQEDVPEIIYTPTADEIRANGNMPIPSDVDVVHCVIDGSTGSTQTGFIQATEMKDLTVYSWFPDSADLAQAVIDLGGNWYKDADSLWTNHITIYDTVWTPGPSISLVNNSVFIDCKLWIEGEIVGKQTYGCSDTIYISGDITYANTQPGNPPDDDENPNMSDYFGLVSEQKILIAYKHRDFEGTIHDDNTDGIMLYGAFAAIAKADENIYTEQEASHYDGIFTFQYHHRHGSTPNFWGISPSTGNDTLYQYVDLQKWIFPPNVFTLEPEIEGFELGSNPPAPGFPTSGFPYEDPNYINSYPNNGPNYAYPYGTDYPWYNPVWPESQADLTWYDEGSTIITLFGAIAQTRRGFVRRSGSDDFNHPPGQNEWNLDQYHFGGDHAPTGYDKDYSYDKRFLYVQPPDYPQIYRGWAGNTETSFEDQSMFFKSPPEGGLN